MTFFRLLQIVAQHRTDGCHADAAGNHEGMAVRFRMEAESAQRIRDPDGMPRSDLMEQRLLEARMFFSDTGREHQVSVLRRRSDRKDTDLPIIRSQIKAPELPGGMLSRLPGIPCRNIHDITVDAARFLYSLFQTRLIELHTAPPPVSTS